MFYTRAATFSIIFMPQNQTCDVPSVRTGRRNRRQRGHPGWTNLRSLRDFDVQEIITDDNNNSEGYTVLLGRFRWQVRRGIPPPGAEAMRELP